MNLLWLLVVILLVVAIFGAPGVVIPTERHGLGWTPSGVVTLVVIVLVILLLTGRL